MSKYTNRAARDRWVFFGGIVGGFLGLLLSPIFKTLYPWHHTKIDVKNHKFSDIALVVVTDKVDASRDKIILRNDKGDYYSYHQNKWQLTELPIEQTRIPVPWCGSLKSTYSTRRCDFQSEMALAEFFRSYVLFTDGSLHLYTKLYGAFHVTGMLSVSLIIGMIIGGVMGRNTEYK